MEQQFNQLKYNELSNKYDTFIYNNFSYEIINEDFVMTFNFICNENSFSPTHTIKHKSFFSFNRLNKKQLDLLVFNIGMIELISYWKATCSKTVIIKPYKITDKQILFWKKLYFNGLGEFFYLNDIHTTIEDFMNIVCQGEEELSPTHFELKQEYLVPIGGGKDSVVSLELLRGKGKDITPLIISPRGATLDCVRLANFDRNEIVETQRTIDKNLLDLNSKGYLNGHTPFSAMLAFTSLLLAGFTEKRYIALSNESSANESTVKGENINHQYSKSLEFENDFRSYYKEFISEDFEYFSLLRQIPEIHIAYLFSHLQYKEVFKSCNVGSKQDIWCGECAKCLFAFIILSPFINPEELNHIFNKNLFADEKLKDILLQLMGQTDVKPFECVGTVKEVNVALAERVKRFEVKEEDVLLKFWQSLKVSQDYIGKNWQEFIMSETSEGNLPQEIKDIFKNPYLTFKKATLSRELRKQRISIMGFGREGKATYNLLSKLLPKKNFIIFDKNEELLKNNEEIMQRNNIIFSSEEDYTEINDRSDKIFLTPGIALKDIAEIETKKITNECDVFLQLFKENTIGISGTKGKSTTSTLLYQIIHDQNPNTILAGNIGVPFFDIMDNIDKDTLIVLELSCHQLQNISVAPHYSILLNLFEEHLDHYNSYEEYQLSKINLLTKGKEDDIFAYNVDSKEINHWVKRFNLKHKYLPFSVSDYKYDEPKFLQGDHNKMNIVACLKIAKELNLDTNKAIETAINFKGLSHRLQFVIEKDGVTYYNDSISTIPQATMAALSALKNVSTLILGGMDRGIDYTMIGDVVKIYKVKNIAFVGKAGRRMYEVMKKQNLTFNAFVSDSYPDIVAWCKQTAEKNSIVLLSPAASSYDMFKNFEYRGQCFEELVLKS